MTGSTGSRTKRGAARPPTAERITVALIPEAAADLKKLRERTGLSKTDIVNRAISLYEFIDSKRRDGHDLVVRDQETRETEIVTFF